MRLLARVGRHDQRMHLDVQSGAWKYNLQDFGGGRSQRLVRVPEAQGMSRKTSAAQEDAQPLAVPRRSAGEELMIPERLETISGRSSCSAHAIGVP